VACVTLLYGARFEVTDGRDGNPRRVHLNRGAKAETKYNEAIRLAPAHARHETGSTACEYRSWVPRFHCVGGGFNPFGESLSARP
jgi:hypothetical protein